VDAGLLILGGGPAGYSAAYRAVAAGVKPVIVEKFRLGGTCLQTGCIPTKTLVAGAEALSRARRGEAFGFQTGEIRVATASLHARKRAVVDALTASLGDSLRRKGVAIIEGTATMTAPDRVSVVTGAGTVEDINARRVVICTGSAPRTFADISPVPGRIMTSEELIRADTWPASLLVVGGGAIGVEFACLLSRLGVNITIVEAMGSLLAGEDAEIGRRVARTLSASGVEVRVNEGLKSVELGAGSVMVTTTTGAVLEREALLLATGRGPVLDGIPAGILGLALTEKGAIRVDGEMRTSLPGIFAAGDVTGGIQLAHAAMAQGRKAAATALNVPDEVDLETVPRCVYSIPEVACVGLSEEEVRGRNIKYRKSSVPFRALGRAHCLDEVEGFVKVIAEEGTGKLLGVHMLGHGVSEMISEAGLAISAGMTASRVACVQHPHPTLSEAFQEACIAVAV
jgi:dihydrolipoamide dehydrogenase